MKNVVTHNEAHRSDLADDQLVAHALTAQHAFGALVDRYYSRVYAAAYAYTGNREAAEEVAQETFLRAYLHLSTLENSAAFGGWVVKIARNLAYNWKAQGQVRSKLATMVPIETSLFELEDVATQSPRDTAAAREEKLIVQKALQKLSPPDRELVILHFMDDISQSDLARQLGVYPSTISRRLEKALATLRLELGRFFPGAANALAPSAAGARRTGLLIAAAASLPATSKAALIAAAGAVPAATASVGAASEPGQPIFSQLISGGKLMATTKAIAVCILGLCIVKAALPDISVAQPVNVNGHRLDNRAEYGNIETAPIGRNVAIAAPAAPSLTSSIRPTMPFWQLASVEGEECKVTSPDFRIEPEEWACGSQHLAHWGDLGDSLEWQVSVPEVLGDARIGVRFAYDADDYMRKTNSPAGDHVAHLYIDGNGPIILTFPDTEGWNWYQIATAELPLLDAGTHTFKLTSPLEYQAANIDALTLYRGDVEAAPPGPLRPSVVATSEEKKVIVLASPNAVLNENADTIAATYHQLLLLMEADFGRDLQAPVYVHFVEPKRWDHRNGRAIKNQHGIYLVADNKSERAEWCWVLAEYIADPQVPRWFRESLCRTNGLLDWLPSLPASTTTEEDLLATELVAEADRFLADPATTCSRIEVVHTAVRARYGDGVFKKFWQEVVSKTADPVPAADGTQTRVLQTVDLLDKNVLIGLLSSAAGEDVAPMYRRWTGFAGELPIDPIVVTDEQAQL